MQKVNFKIGDKVTDQTFHNYVGEIISITKTKVDGLKITVKFKTKSWLNGEETLSYYPDRIDDLIKI